MFDSILLLQIRKTAKVKQKQLVQTLKQSTMLLFFPAAAINSSWISLQDCRQKFRAVLVEATLKLDEQVKRIGRAVDDSKPYWEARKAARQVRTCSVQQAGDASPEVVRQVIARASLAAD